ncbi:MAG: sigma 54-interacting transcriptional regulator [Rhodoferax sp.]|uniref:sigma-54 interaction domain-containing protein n=1 Tax=Rhodoferax sp. TaxID=50421 RepID=UPI001B57EA28|nr:sigma 54-interacting transcriptional regulator [Rhodoferax sp.]MBP9806657.1 sigma 54-interacting transcriptional regulator [Accumulibacter sp.]MBP9904925.1 sigma 54-interacting transcriptional regulator [Rhodoferax sp.]
MNLNKISSFLDSFDEPSIVMDANYRILSANQAYLRDFSNNGPVVGRLCYEISHRFSVPCDQAGESCPLQASRSSNQKERVLHLHYTAHGEEHVDVETTPIRDDNGERTLYVETMRVVRQASSRPASQGLVGRSPAFTRMLARVMRVAPSMAAVMLLGETGTGKELMARAIHEGSARAARPFVPVDCSGLTESLFESELFGYEKGAFTGATHRKQGLIESASGGTLFLDEIGDLPPALQVKLLRLLETGTYRRVGGVEVLPADFRLISATHRDLEALVKAEAFRRDLYFRINTFPIYAPSLRDRAPDLSLLVESLLSRVAPGRELHLSAEAMTLLAAMPFEGNIRELRNLLERASLLADGDEIESRHILDMESEAEASTVTRPKEIDGTWLTLKENEHRYLAWAVAAHQGDRPALARQLGISERTLFRKLGNL